MSTAAAKPGVLFVTYGAGHADIVRRIYTRLEQTGDLRIEVLALTTAVNVLSRHGIPFRTISDLFPVEGYEHARERGAPLSEAIWSPESGIQREDSDLYLGASMLDLEAEAGERGARRLYEQQGRRAFCPVRFLERILGIIRPDLVVITCLVRMEKAALLAARAMGLRSVLIEDLFGYSLLGDTGLESGALQLPKHLLPDDVVVMNDAVADRLVRHGIPDGRVHALGQPVFSEWAEEFEQATPDRYFEDLGGSLITYIAPARVDVLLDHARSILKLATERADIGFYFKLHPSTPRSWLVERIGEVPDNMLVARDLDLAGIIKASDTVIVFRSSVGLLTLMAGKRLVVFDHTGEPETLPYVASGAAPLATSVEALSTLIDSRTGVFSGGEEAAVPPLFQSPKGATARIASFLADKAHQGSAPGSGVEQ